MNQSLYCAIARDYMKKTGKHSAGQTAKAMLRELKNLQPPTWAIVDEGKGAQRLYTVISHDEMANYMTDYSNKQAM